MNNSPVFQLTNQNHVFYHTYPSIWYKKVKIVSHNQTSFRATRSKSQKIKA